MSSLRKRFTCNGGTALILIARARRYQADTNRAPRPVGSGLIIVQALDTHARTFSIPAWHSTTECALAMQQKRSRGYCEDDSNRNGNAFEIHYLFEVEGRLSSA